MHFQVLKALIGVTVSRALRARGRYAHARLRRGEQTIPQLLQVGSLLRVPTPPRAEFEFGLSKSYSNDLRASADPAGGASTPDPVTPHRKASLGLRSAGSGYQPHSKCSKYVLGGATRVQHRWYSLEL